MNNYTASKELVKWIIEHEGFSSVAYFDDYAGTPNVVEYSIGYGHQIQPGEEYLKTATITKAQAGELMEADLNKNASFLQKKLKVKVNQSQFDALLNLCYAVGPGNASYIINMINEGKPKAEIITAWAKFGTWWQGKQWPALVKMRAREIDLFYNSGPGAVTFVIIALALIATGFLIR